MLYGNLVSVNIVCIICLFLSVEFVNNRLFPFIDICIVLGSVTFVLINRCNMNEVEKRS